jgi:hypothetical protein
MGRKRPVGRSDRETIRGRRWAPEWAVWRGGLDGGSAHGTAVFASCLCFERPSLGIPLSALAPMAALS